MKKILLLGVFSLFIFFGSISVVRAADSFACQCADGTQSKETVCTDCAKKCKAANPSSTQSSCVKSTATVTAGTSNTAIPNPLGAGTTIESLTGRIINYVLGLVGTISLLLFIYGGLIWMTSAGSSEKVKKGRDIIVWAVIGMAVVFMSYIAVKFIIEGLQGTMK